MEDMPDGDDAITVLVAGPIGSIPAAAWDACAGTGAPFVSHAFLSALEDSGSVSAETGWLAQHLVVDDGRGGVLGCVPLYLKSHSYGEYVFDWNWADAYERGGGRYYPKLQSAVPFTPVTGPRLLVRPGAPEGVERALAGAMVELARRHGVSSLHVTFPTRDQWQHLGSAGFLLRTGHQYHWENHGYRTFDDFLSDLASRKRKAIRRERRDVAESGVTLRTLGGADMTEGLWDAFFAFYRDTSERKWGNAYLNRDFFSLLGERLGDRVVMVLAEAGGRPVGGALNLRGDDTLFGRYWGALEDFRFLHFEACYYQAIDYAIAHGLTRVEAGAQGRHKIQRGYLPTPTYSVHWFADPGFHEAVARWLESETEAVTEEIRELAAGSPFRNG